MTQENLKNIFFIVGILLITTTFIFVYFLNKKINKTKTINQKKINESNNNNLNLIKEKIYFEIKNIIDESLKWAKNYDPIREVDKVSKNKKETKRKFKKIISSFDYKNIEIDGLEKEIFEIWKKLENESAIYWNKKFSNELENFYKWKGQKNE